MFFYTFLKSLKPKKDSRMFTCELPKNRGKGTSVTSLDCVLDYEHKVIYEKPIINCPFIPESFSNCFEAKNTFGSDSISIALEQEACLHGVTRKISRFLQLYNKYLKDISNSSMDNSSKTKCINLVYDSFKANSKNSNLPYSVSTFYLNYLKMTKMKTISRFKK